MHSIICKFDKNASIYKDGYLNVSIENKEEKKEEKKDDVKHIEVK